MPYTVWGLALAQALLTTGNILLVAVSALIGKQLASHPALVTAPVASQFLGLILATLPAAFLMQKLGRKKVFVIGNVFGIIGALVAIQALLSASLLLFTLGIFLTGIAIGIAQQYRFAALDECRAESHAKAISVVMSGGVLAAFIGPNLAIWSQNWFSQNVYVGAFVGLAVLYVLALLLIVCLPLKSHTLAKQASAEVRSYRELWQQPLFVAAIASGAIGYGVMVFLMTATPLAMHHHDYAFPDIAVVIQWHVLGMFVPSFFTGHLIKKTRFETHHHARLRLAHHQRPHQFVWAKLCALFHLLGIAWHRLEFHLYWRHPTREPHLPTARKRQGTRHERFSGVHHRRHRQLVCRANRGNHRLDMGQPHQLAADCRGHVAHRQNPYPSLKPAACKPFTGRLFYPIGNTLSIYLK